MMFESIRQLRFDNKPVIIICPNCPEGYRTHITIHRKRLKRVICPRCQTAIKLENGNMV